MSDSRISPVLSTSSAPSPPITPPSQSSLIGQRRKSPETRDRDPSILKKSKTALNDS